MFWQIKTSSDGTYVDMPDPSSLTIDGEDLDVDTGRSIINGNIIRNILGFKWQKAQFEFPFKTEAQAATLLNIIKNTYPIYLRVKSPLFCDNDGYTELVGYISKIHCEYQPAYVEGGWVVSFNFVEGVR